MMLPIMVVSAFMNNTPIVAIMIPVLTAWSRKAGLAPGHLMMPLSFASVLGGTCSLIGTSTNLVVAGQQKRSFPDMPPIQLFDLSPYGVPVAIVGGIYIILFAPRLLPGKALNRSEYVPSHPACRFSHLRIHIKVCNVMVATH
jgi:Na+/H+ antiporter NhaD/arsenite permease-like protein